MYYYNETHRRCLPFNGGDLGDQSPEIYRSGAQCGAMHGVPVLEKPYICNQGKCVPFSTAGGVQLKGELFSKKQCEIMGMCPEEQSEECGNVCTE